VNWQSPWPPCLLSCVLRGESAVHKSPTLHDGLGGKLIAARSLKCLHEQPLALPSATMAAWKAVVLFAGKAGRERESGIESRPTSGSPGRGKTRTMTSHEILQPGTPVRAEISLTHSKQTPGRSPARYTFTGVPLARMTGLKRAELANHCSASNRYTRESGIAVTPRKHWTGGSSNRYTRRSPGQAVFERLPRALSLSDARSSSARVFPAASRPQP
jgi:hypothetical protein